MRDVLRVGAAAIAVGVVLFAACDDSGADGDESASESPWTTEDTTGTSAESTDSDLGAGWDLMIDQHASSEVKLSDFDQKTGEFYVGGDDLRLPLGEQELSELEAARDDARATSCRAYVDNQSRGEAIAELMFTTLIHRVAVERFDGEYTAPIGDLGLMVGASAGFYTESNVLAAHQQFVKGCDVKVPEGFEFETAIELGIESPFVARFVNTLARGPVGCTTTLEFTETGTFYVYKETGAPLPPMDGCVPSADPDQPFGFEVTGPSGPLMPVAVASSGSYRTLQRNGLVIARIEVEVPGEYEIVVVGDDPNAVAAIGRAAWG